MIVVLLFDVTGSTTAAVTAAVFEMIPAFGGAVPMIMIEGAVPAERRDRVHVAMPPATVHVQPLPLALTHVMPGGKTSRTTTDVALPGPEFVALMVYVSIPPAVTGSGESSLVIDRSMPATTVVCSASRLFERSLSCVADDTIAVLLIVPAVDGDVTVIVIAGAGPTAKLDRVEVTIPLALIIVHPVPDEL